MKQKKLAQLVALIACLMLLFTSIGCKTAEEPTGTEAPEALTANETTPLVIGSSTLDGTFSPFFATSAYDVDAMEFTQLLLLYYDKRAAAGHSDESPRLAYSVQKARGDRYDLCVRAQNGVTIQRQRAQTAKDASTTSSASALRRPDHLTRRRSKRVRADERRALAVAARS